MTRPLHPPFPDRAALAPLAASLAQQDWTEAALTLHLRQRLPGNQPARAAQLARSLLRRFPARAAPDAAQILRHLRGSPQGRAVLAHARRYHVLPAHSLTSPAFNPIPPLQNLPLPPMVSEADLADWLAITPDQLTRFADLRGLSARTDSPWAAHYHHHLIPKSNGQLRLIEEPKPFLKRLHRRILSGLLNHIPPHPAAYGFVQGRNCLQAAARHAGEQIVVSFDLAHFFPSIRFPQIYALFRAFGYPAQVARSLAGLTTAITPAAILRQAGLAARDQLSNRHLPQGAPTSPALANLVALHLDRRLAGLAQSLDATYTRYADDLTFSGDTRIAAVLHRAVPQIVAEQGFVLNPSKTRAQPSHHRQTVTSITVNATLNPARESYDLLKATIHHLTRPSDPRRHDLGFLASLQGRIAWVAQINPAKGAKLQDRLATALLTRSDS
ncbi:reverse transcriptase family protein [Cypionkella sinensis]|uniref:RNA-directed DNA polymerase n=1 Tax=Cypionkella sinensis TaxID=1756043 RepID=A0ABV7J1I9_9RHOB